MEGWSTQIRNGLYAFIVPSPTVVIMHLLSSAKGRWTRQRALNALRNLKIPIHVIYTTIPRHLHNAALVWLLHAHAPGAHGTERCGVTNEYVSIVRLP